MVDAEHKRDVVFICLTSLECVCAKTNWALNPAYEGTSGASPWAEAQHFSEPKSGLGCQRSNPTAKWIQWPDWYSSIYIRVDGTQGL